MFLLLLIGVFGGANSQCLLANELNLDEYIKFYLSTSTTKLYLLNKNRLPEAPFDGSASMLKVLIHGYKGDKTTTPNYELLTLYRSLNKYNILTVDFGLLVKEPCYRTSIDNAPEIGTYLADMIQLIYDTVQYISANTTHLVGFGLGGHVAAFASNQFKDADQLWRITGLDPDGPEFQTKPQSEKLDATDATFVDIIHTDASIFGYFPPLGDADFYVNRGYHQPKCLSDPATVNQCSHSASASYFKESVNTFNPAPIGRECEVNHQATDSTILVFLGWNVCKIIEDSTKTAIMGEYADPKMKGVYNVVIKEHPAEPMAT